VSEVLKFVIFRLIFLACLAEFLRTKHQQIPQLSLTHIKSSKHQKQQPFPPKTKHPGQISKELNPITSIRPKFSICVRFRQKIAAK